MKKKVGRPKALKETVSLSIKFEKELWEKIKDIAALESATSGKCITGHQLIRDAANFTYECNERMRECFRRSRSCAKKKNY